MNANHYMRESGEFQFVSEETESAIFQQVQIALGRLNDAFIHHDSATISRLMTSDHVTITPAVYFLSRTEALESVKQYDLKEYTVSSMEMKLLNPSTVMTTFLARIQGWFNQMDVSGAFQVSALWVRRRGIWKEAWYQETGMGY